MGQCQYDAGFFRRESDASAIGARAILPLVFEAYHPRTVLDVGCGVGQWCIEALRLGAVNATGIDGPWVKPAQGQGPGLEHWHFLARNLEESLPAAVKWDLALCLEVAEHLPPERGPGLVFDLCRLSSLILWSAAVPGQGGEGHVNERPEAYWEGLFAANGFAPDYWIREAIRGRAEVPVWYRNNVVLYRRG